MRGWWGHRDPHGVVTEEGQELQPFIGDTSFINTGGSLFGMLCQIMQCKLQYVIVHSVQFVQMLMKG